ncbi:MAG: hypothetical protein RTV31_06375 [Candidatus Thorarchaeota archaeon]
MRNRKKHKTIDDFSVSQLLDDFIKVDALDNGRPPKKIDDEDYIRMMLKKDAQKKLERTKRFAQEHAEVLSPQHDTIDDNIRRRFFPDVSEGPIKRELPPVEEKKPPVKREQPTEKIELPQEENGIVEDILDSIVVKDVSGLAAQMKEAVDFVQDEMGTSESERRLIEALEECMKPAGCAKKESDPSMYNDNVLLLKRCQNCYFCVGEKNQNGSLWCFCTNPDRSTNVEIEDSWVKSKLNLPCWKAPKD